MSNTVHTYDECTKIFRELSYRYIPRDRRTIAWHKGKFWMIYSLNSTEYSISFELLLKLKHQPTSEFNMLENISWSNSKIFLKKPVHGFEWNLMFMCKHYSTYIFHPFRKSGRCTIMFAHKHELLSTYISYLHELHIELRFCFKQLAGLEKTFCWTSGVHSGKFNDLVFGGFESRNGMQIPDHKRRKYICVVWKGLSYRLQKLNRKLCEKEYF